MLPLNSPHYEHLYDSLGSHELIGSGRVPAPGRVVYAEWLRYQAMLEYADPTVTSVSELLKDRTIKQCLQSKLGELKSPALRSLFPEHFHMQPIFYIFSLWIFDLCSRYRAINPESEEIDAQEAKLIRTLCDWRYRPKDAQLRQAFFGVVAELRTSLAAGDPSHVSLEPQWQSLLHLMRDDCGSARVHWDWDGSYFDYDNWVGERKKGAHNPEALFLIEKPAKWLELCWQRNLSAFSTTAHKAMLTVVDQHSAELLRINTELAQLSAQSQALWALLNERTGRNGIPILLEICQRIPVLLGELESVSLETADWSKAQAAMDELMIRIRGLTRDDAGFAEARAQPPHAVAARIKDLEQRGVEDARDFIRLNLEHVDAVASAHRILDGLVASPVILVLGNLFIALRYNSEAQRDFARRVAESEKAASALLKELSTQKKAKKPPGRQQTKKSPKPAAKQKKPAVEAKPKRPVTPPSPAVEIAAPAIQPILVTSLLSKNSSAGLARTAKQVDLLRRLLPACSTLADKLHPLTARRIAYYSAHQLLEAVLTLKGQMIGAPEEVLTSHNLWAAARVAGVSPVPGIIEDLFHASFWVRFPVEQRSAWRDFVFEHSDEPAVLTELLDPATGSRNALGQRIERTLAAARRILHASYPDEDRTTFGPLAHREDTLRKPKGTVPLELTVLLSNIRDHTASRKEMDLWNSWAYEVEDLGRTLTQLLETTDRAEHLLLLNHATLCLQHAVEYPLRLLVLRATGRHTKSHNLSQLLEQANQPLSGLQEATLMKNLDWVRITHRYPFTFEQPQSTLHHAQLSAIALLESLQIDASLLKVSQQRRALLEGTRELLEIAEHLRKQLVD